MQKQLPLENPWSNRKKIHPDMMCTTVVGLLIRVVLNLQKFEKQWSHPLKWFSWMKNLSCKIFRKIEQYLEVAQGPQSWS